MARKPAVTNFVHALAAVLLGNGLYLLLWRYLPARARHVPFRFDLGIVVDFWLFGAIKTVAGLHASRRRNKT